jgi:cbb3-type cytochrome oxidase subunit 1
MASSSTAFVETVEAKHPSYIIRALGGGLFVQAR